MKISDRSIINRSQSNTRPTLAWLVSFLGLTAASGGAVGAADCSDSVWDTGDDERYVTRFNEHHGLHRSRVAPLATYLEIRNYDRFNGAVLDDRLALVARSGADQGWSPTVGVDSWSVSLNEMYRHTGDRRYFDENLKLVRVVINNRDDRRVPQEQLWNGFGGAAVERRHLLLARTRGLRPAHRANRLSDLRLPAASPRRPRPAGPPSIPVSTTTF